LSGVQSELARNWKPKTE